MPNRKVIHIFSVAMTPAMFLTELIKQLESRGIENHIYCGTDSFLPVLINTILPPKNSLIIAPLSREKSITSLIRVAQAVHSILRFNSQKEDTIILAHTPIIAAAVAVARPFISRETTIVYFCHGLISTHPDNSLKRRALKFFEKFVCNTFNSFIFVSPSLARFALANNFIPDKSDFFVSKSAKGVNLPRVRHGSLLRPHAMTIGYLGRITRDKGVEDLIQLSTVLHSRGVKFEIKAAGTIEDQSLLDRVIANTPSMEFVGHITDRSAFFSKIDILFIPSRREGFCMVAIEAAASGVPVLAYDIIGIEDAIEDKQSGFLAQPFNVCEIAQYIEIYLRNPLIYATHSELGAVRARRLFHSTTVNENLANAIDQKLRSGMLPDIHNKGI